MSFRTYSAFFFLPGILFRLTDGDRNILMKFSNSGISISMRFRISILFRIFFFESFFFFIFFIFKFMVIVSFMVIPIWQSSVSGR